MASRPWIVDSAPEIRFTVPSGEHDYERLGCEDLRGHNRSKASVIAPQ